MKTLIKDLSEIIRDGTQIPKPWRCKVVTNDDNMTYVAWNEASMEALVVDPMREDWNVMMGLFENQLRSFRFLCVIDTHTHADHVSCAADLAVKLGVPLVQHIASPSKRVHLRVSRDTCIPAVGGALKFLLTPGHTPEGITPIWGPFIFGGDTLLFGDTGRDDLPGGEPGDHWESIQKIKQHATPEMILLPGHDGLGGRASSWRNQLEINPGLSQDRPTFISDAGAYIGPSPKLLKESLYENFK